VVDSVEFGWDNEFPACQRMVEDFEIGKYPITNSQFLEFVSSGAYNEPKFWREKDWEWKTAAQLVPHLHSFEKFRSLVVF
jgi:formylglycine-generating enzyme required for sulfatase activity